MFNRRNFLKNMTLGSGVILTGAACENISVQMESDSEVIETIKKRRSVRKYKSDPVPEKDIKLILDAARMAPTAGNQQPWHFLMIQEQSKIEALKEACIKTSMGRFANKNDLSESEIKEQTTKIEDYYKNVFSAPVYIVVMTDNESKYPSYNHHDGPLAAANLMIAARSLGYGTVYYTDSVPDHVSQEILNIPERYKRVCFTPVGVPDKWPDSPEKKSLESLVSWGEISK